MRKNLWFNFFPYFRSKAYVHRRKHKMKKQYLIMLLFASSILSLAIYSCQKNQGKTDDKSINSSMVASAAKSSDVSPIGGKQLCIVLQVILYVMQIALFRLLYLLYSGAVCSAGCYFGIGKCICEQFGERSSGSGSMTLKKGNMDALITLLYEKWIKNTYWNPSESIKNCQLRLFLRLMIIIMIINHQASWFEIHIQTILTYLNFNIVSLYQIFLRNSRKRYQLI